jgi:peroxiredoxin
MAEKLRDGDHFPTLTVETVKHGRLTIPDDLKSRWAVLLFYRGWW